MKDYPSLLPYWKRSVFPKALQRTLQAASKQLAKGDISEDVLSAVLAGLSHLPPQACVSGAREITALAIPYPSRQTNAWDSLLSLFRKTAHSLLACTPGLEYLFLFHWDGRLREAALKQIAEPLPSAFWVAAIALRLNDWAGPVRAAATDCARRAFAKTSPDILVTAARYLLAQRRLWQRGEEELLVLDAALARPDVKMALVQDILTDTTGMSRKVLQVLLRDTGIDDRLAEISRLARNAATRALALATLMRAEARWPDAHEQQWVDKSMGLSRRITRFAARPLAFQPDITVLIAQGAADKSALVRKVALQALIDRRELWPDSQNWISRFADDRSPNIQQGADYILRHMADKA